MSDLTEDNSSILTSALGDYLQLQQPIINGGLSFSDQSNL